MKIKTGCVKKKILVVVNTRKLYIKTINKNKTVITPI